MADAVRFLSFKADPAGIFIMPVLQSLTNNATGIAEPRWWAQLRAS